MLGSITLTKRTLIIPLGNFHLWGNFIYIYIYIVKGKFCYQILIERLITNNE